jgi:peptidoglycan hydrolase FlgJ
MNPIQKPTFYADPQALASLKQGAKAQDPAALKEAAKQFESLFTQMLLKGMREANKSIGDSMFGSDQADFYQSMFDDQMAVQLSKGKGLGLADMLIRQLTTAGTAAPAADSRAEPPEFSAVGRPHGAAVSVHAPLATSKADFVKSMLPHAQQAARELGVDPHALLAQAALETGWGKSVPCAADGTCSFNLFGIKAMGRWDGASVTVPTIEFEDGLPVRKAERFRAYAAPADSFRDYAALIRNNPRYENALGAGDDIASFASALQQGGYATDPDYARKLIAIADDLRKLAPAATVKSTADEPITSFAGVRS